jgi:hypothetical protein
MTRMLLAHPTEQWERIHGLSSPVLQGTLVLLGRMTACKTKLLLSLRLRTLVEECKCRSNESCHSLCDGHPVGGCLVMSSCGACLCGAGLVLPRFGCVPGVLALAPCKLRFLLRRLSPCGCQCSLLATSLGPLCNQLYGLPAHMSLTRGLTPQALALENCFTMHAL